LRKGRLSRSAVESLIFGAALALSFERPRQGQVAPSGGLREANAKENEKQPSNGSESSDNGGHPEVFLPFLSPR
jgi:hypothetical protein